MADSEARGPARATCRIWTKLARLGGLAACLAAVPALAQTVPLPAPRPKLDPPAVTGSVGGKAAALAAARAIIVPGPASATTASTPQTTSASPAAPQNQPLPNPIISPPADMMGQPGTTTALDDQQRAIIKKVDTYLSDTKVLSGDFVQVGPNGHRSKGEFYIEKPGRVRFDYDPPSPTQIVADGQTVVVRDRALNTQDIYPLSQTPLRFLLSNKVNLMKDTNLVAVYADDVFITVVVEEKNPVVGTSRLMVMFSAKTMQLKQWTITDPQGFDTTVAVYNLDTTDTPNPKMFTIDYTNYHN
jgi:outer membrane lipoprotein-sorting protein